jgi:Uma2 family endonuclease
MTIFDLSTQRNHRAAWRNADWSMYLQALDWLNGNRAFVTFYRGRLEIVTPSFQHDRTATLLLKAVTILAEETGKPLVSARSTTLQREDLLAAVEADDAFYIEHANLMSSRRRDIKLPEDPPPDLVVEVEVTHRLKERIDIYRELGVPELWRYSERGLEVLLNRRDHWEKAARSPTFPQLSPEEISGFISAGLSQEETSWAKGFRKRVQECVQ